MEYDFLESAVLRVEGSVTHILSPATEGILISHIFLPGCQGASQGEHNFSSPQNTLSATTRSSVITSLPTPFSLPRSSGKIKRAPPPRCLEEESKKRLRRVCQKVILTNKKSMMVMLVSFCSCPQNWRRGGAGQPLPAPSGHREAGHPSRIPRSAAAPDRTGEEETRWSAEDEETRPAWERTGSKRPPLPLTLTSNCLTLNSKDAEDDSVFSPLILVKSWRWTELKPLPHRSMASSVINHSLSFGLTVITAALILGLKLCILCRFNIPKSLKHSFFMPRLFARYQRRRRKQRNQRVMTTTAEWRCTSEKRRIRKTRKIPNLILWK